MDLEEMIDDPVRMYLREAGGVSLLSAREEKVLARREGKSRSMWPRRKPYVERTEIQLTTRAVRNARTSSPQAAPGPRWSA